MQKGVAAVLRAEGAKHFSMSEAYARPLIRNGPASAARK